MKKAQASVEFTILIAFMFLIFLVYLGVIQEKSLDIAKNSDRLLLEELGQKIKIELDNAVFVENGFRYNFTLPANLLDKDYEIKLCAYHESYTDEDNNVRGTCGTGVEVTFPELVLKYADKPSENVIKISRTIIGTMDSLKEENCLRKENDRVYVNDPNFLCT